MKPTETADTKSSNIGADIGESAAAVKESALARIKNLLHHPELWRAGQLAQKPDTLSSGFAALDEHLPGHGWSRAGLAEFLLDTSGVGELRLLAPLMRELSRTEHRWLAWINPPFVPYAPALKALGIDISRILLIHPKNHGEALWALERASRSGTCSLALAWLDERQLQFKDTRRLQLAAREGRTLTCLFRPSRAMAVNTMAELRLQMTLAETGSVALDIRKRRGGWPVSGIQLQLSERRCPREIREQLSLWRHQRQQRSEVPAGAFADLESGPSNSGTHDGDDAGASALDVVTSASDSGSRVTH